MPIQSSFEVDGVFLDRESLNGAVDALKAAGFRVQDMAVVFEHRAFNHRPSADAPPQPEFHVADKSQLRTLRTGLAGAVVALVAAGATILTGGAAAAIAAMVVAGASAATGIHIYKAAEGFDGSGREERPNEDAVLSIELRQANDEQRVVSILERHGARKIWSQRGSH